MSTTSDAAIRLTDFEPRVDTFREDFVAGLRRNPKQIPPKYFYDAPGSRLFDRICELEEYFPTRTEKALLEAHCDEIRQLAGPRCRLVEYGSGSSEKTRLLLDHLDEPTAYVPIEISRDHLLRASDALSRRYPAVEMLPVCADYTEHYEAPRPTNPHEQTLFFFPGSTIGNFLPVEALAFLKGVAAQAAPGDGLLIGIGLQTDCGVLERAYNDSEGVTAAFNLNLLERARRELGAKLDPDSFRHEAIYDARHARIEMRLVSRQDTAIEVDGESFSVQRGEVIVTEYSHKFTDLGFTRMAAHAGFRARRRWTDPDRCFSVHYLVRGAEASEQTVGKSAPVTQALRRMRGAES